MLPSALVSVRSTPTHRHSIVQVIMTRRRQAPPKSLSTCQMAPAGMSIEVLQEVWVIRDCYLACSRKYLSPLDALLRSMVCRVWAPPALQYVVLQLLI